MNKPIVTVLTITYGHESYISETIKGVLNQEVSFPIEMIIADDCSHDNTEGVVNDYIENHPNGGIIRYFKHKQNKGVNSNFDWASKLCRGKYVAVCEGDDYWTDPLKLQSQVDFLDSHEGYSMCFHNVVIFNDTQQKFHEDNITRTVSDTTGLKDLARGNYIHTPSVLFRSDIFPLPNWFEQTPIGDFPLWCLSALNGKIYKMPNKMAVYRVHDKGAMSGFKKANLSDQIIHNEGMIPFYRAIYSQSGELGFKHNEVHLLDVNRSNYIKLGEYSKARKVAILILKNQLKFLSIKQITASLLTLLVPFYLKRRYANK